MGFLTDKRGSLSWFRVSVLVLVIGAFFLGFGFLTFQADQASRRSPFYPELPPNAAQWGVPQVITGTNQKTFYRVPAGIAEDIDAFYEGKLKQFYGVSEESNSSLEKCQRNPTVGEYTDIPDVQRPANDGKIFDPSFVAGVSVGYLYRCMFDRSTLNATQSTLVEFYPGTPNSDPALNTQGDIVIVYDQRWQQ